MLLKTVTEEEEESEDDEDDEEALSDSSMDSNSNRKFVMKDNKTDIEALQTREITGL